MLPAHSWLWAVQARWLNGLMIKDDEWHPLLKGSCKEKLALGITP